MKGKKSALKSGLDVCISVCLIMFNLGCDLNTKQNYIRTDRISSNCFVEHFIARKGGVFTGNTYVCYITDSISFRNKIDSYDDDETIEYSVKKNFVVVKIKPKRIYGIEDKIRERSFVYPLSL